MAGHIPTLGNTLSQVLLKGSLRRLKPRSRLTCYSSALVRDGHLVLRRRAVSRRISWRRIRGFEGVLESFSANRLQSSGVPFKDGKPQGDYQNFATGFWVSGQNRAEVWGGPTALAVMKDGSLLIADDTGGTIWRVSYNGPKQQADQPAESQQRP